MQRISYQNLISFAAGELDEQESKEIAEYLETHADAAAVVAEYGLLRELFHYLSFAQPPEALLEKARSLYRSRPFYSLLYTPPADFSFRKSPS